VSSAVLGVSLSKRGLAVRNVMNAESNVPGRVRIRQDDLLSADISKETVEGVSAGNAGPETRALNSAVTIGAGIAHRNFGDTVHSASTNPTSVPGGRV